MYSISSICICKRCKDIAKFNQLKVVDSGSTITLVREYICDCGFTTKYEDKVTFKL